MMTVPSQRQEFSAAQKADALPSAWLEGLAGCGSRVALACASNSSGELRRFEEVNAQTNGLAQAFAELGLASGDAIAIWLPNSPTWMVAHFAAARAGMTTIPVNTWSRASELEHLLRLGNCRAIIIDSAFKDIEFGTILNAAISALQREGNATLEYVIDRADRRCVANIGTAKHIALSDLLAVRESHTTSSSENQAMIAFATSGTTSLPKLAVHRADALISRANSVVSAAAITAADIVLCALPPCGAYGYGLIMASLSGGAKAILCPVFDLDEIVRMIAAEKVSILALTEPLVRRLLDHPEASKDSLASLRLVFSAGGTLQEVVRRAEENFGFRITNVYGSSETLALTSFWSFETDVATRSAAGGTLVNPAMHVRAVNASGARVPAGTPGELQFRGPELMSHYLDNPSATSRAFGAEGWFSSQDVGVVLDEAGTTFHYIARSDDALRLKGFLVSPGEIEAVLQSHPMVAMAQVVGVPAPDGEDRAVAFVVPVAGQTPDSAELQAHCRSAMASYKTPAVIQIVESFPTTRSANGDKVIKKELRTMAQACL